MYQMRLALGSVGKFWYSFRMDEEDIDKQVQEHFQLIAENAKTLVEPCITGIYRVRTEPKEHVEQVGTAILVRHETKTVLVTAKHVLYGHNYDEEAGDKRIFARGTLTHIGDLGTGEVLRAKDYDLACMIVNELADQPAFKSSQLIGGDQQPREVTIVGYRAGGLRIDKPGGVLMPDARAYTCSSKEQGTGFIGMKFSWRKFKNSEDGQKVNAARPEGLSGGPMLDGDALAAGQARVFGIFTNFKQPAGYAFGESIDKVKAMIAKLTQKRC